MIEYNEERKTHVIYDGKEISIRQGRKRTMTKEQIIEGLQQIIDETDDMEKFAEQWDLDHESLYPFAVGYIRAAIKFIVNDGEIIIE